MIFRTCESTFSRSRTIRGTAAAASDAHGDLHTPESTRSGFLDGMALSIILGRCWRAMADDLGLDPVPERRVHLVGARDLEDAERAFLSASGVGVHGTDARAADLVPSADPSGEDGPTYLHLDLDVLDPEVGTANHYAAPGGFGLEAILELVGGIAGRAPIGAATLSAYDPSADADGAIAASATRLATTVAQHSHRG